MDGFVFAKSVSRNQSRSLTLSFGLDNVLLGILHGPVLLHWALLDLVIKLALVLQLVQNHERLIIVALVEQLTDVLDLLALFHKQSTKQVDRQCIVYLLLRAIC